MAHAQSVTAETTSVAAASSNHQGRWKIFTAIFDALHHSRQLQAEQVILRYRHLIDRAGGRFSLEPNGCAEEHEQADKRKFISKPAACEGADVQ